MNSPMNAEGVFALSALILLLLNSQPEHAGAGAKPGRAGIWLAAILLTTVAVIAPALRFPLVFDEYTLARYGQELNGAFVRYVFTQPGGDGFYRPVGYLSLGVDAFWAGHTSAGWHVFNLALHLINIVLVFLLARRLLQDRATALWSAALFAVHGTVLLTATFLAARFDALATFFVLAGLVLLLRYVQDGDRVALAVSFLCALCGFLTKEIAFSFPLLAMLVTRRWRVLAGYLALAGAAFSHRFWLLKGIGGYRDPATGQPDILHISLLGLLKGFGLRIGAMFEFPVNWSHAPEPWLTIALVAALAALAAIALQSRADCKGLLLTLAFTMAALLPMAHLLLIDASLLGAGRLYLASAGFAMFLATAVQGLKRPASGAAAVVLVLFQIAALRHNLTIWSQTAALAERTCASASRQAQLPRASSLPAQIDGVPFLRNGFEACITFHRVSRPTLPAAR